MDFELFEIEKKNNRYNSGDFNMYLDLIYSHVPRRIPRKRLQYIVREKNTQKIVGLIHPSPIISIKPRHDQQIGVLALLSESSYHHGEHHRSRSTFRLQLPRW